MDIEEYLNMSMEDIAMQARDDDMCKDNMQSIVLFKIAQFLEKIAYDHEPKGN